MTKALENEVSSHESPPETPPDESPLDESEDDESPTDVSTEAVPKVEFDTLGLEHRALKPFTGDDIHRPSFAGVHLKDGAVYVTDGRIAVVVPTRKSPASENPHLPPHAAPHEGSVTIPLGALEKAVRMTAKRSYGGPDTSRVVVMRSPKEDEVVLFATDLQASGEVRTEGIVGEYPNFNKFLAARKGEIAVSISASLLRDLATYAAKFGGRTYAGVPITFYIDPNAPLSHVRFTFRLDGHETPVRGALAVMRVGHQDESVPDEPEFSEPTSDESTPEPPQEEEE